MLWDLHCFQYRAAVPCPQDLLGDADWHHGVDAIEHWLRQRVGSHYESWAWDDPGRLHRIGVAFRWDRDRTLFLICWQ
jgi:hypothetical protein